jgi:hypothetical protein
MSISNQIFVWTAFITLIIELALIAFILIRKKKVLSEQSRKRFANHEKTVLSAMGILLLSLIFEISAEITELFELELGTTLLLNDFSMIGLLLSLILIAKITVDLGWGD